VAGIEVLPALSVAKTLKVCAPSANAPKVMELVQNARLLPFTLHLKHLTK